MARVAHQIELYMLVKDRYLQIDRELTYAHTAPKNEENGPNRDISKDELTWKLNNYS